MATRKQLKRTVLTAVFEAPRGLVNIKDLVDGPEDRWQHLRKEINTRRVEAPLAPIAKCLLCREPIYIRVQSHGSGLQRKAPVFAHFPSSKQPCPWHDGSEITADDPRAAQYRGHQESARHKWLCETIAELLTADPRCENVEVETYRRASIHKRGRFPDVLVKLRNLGEFAIEVQLSKPFATEVVERQSHYDREGVGLIWVFAEIPDPLPQGFQDVITSQRGNAFVFDNDALAASELEGTLVLKAVLEAVDGSGLQSRLVRLDDLQRQRGSALFVEDRRTAKLRAYCQRIRNQWWKALQLEKGKVGSELAESQHFEKLLRGSLQSTRGLEHWVEEQIQKHGGSSRYLLVELVLILFSLVHSATKKCEINYKTRHCGVGSMKAMINSVLDSSRYKPYAKLISKFVRMSAIAAMVQADSVERKLMLAMSTVVQFDEESPIWLALEPIFPEVLKPLVRQELKDLDGLPAWAIA